MWFGDPWPTELLRAPVCEDDTQRVPVPVGATCFWCDDLIDEDDRGSFMGTMDGPVPIHIECSMRSVMGPVAYLEGRCTHAGGTEDCYVEGQTKRQDALATWAWLQENGTPR
jgi:hypothetical protein